MCNLQMRCEGGSSDGSVSCSRCSRLSISCVFSSPFERVHKRKFGFPDLMNGRVIWRLHLKSRRINELEKETIALKHKLQSVVPTTLGKRQFLLLYNRNLLSRICLPLNNSVKWQQNGSLSWYTIWNNSSAPVCNLQMGHSVQNNWWFGGRFSHNRRLLPTVCNRFLVCSHYLFPSICGKWWLLKMLSSVCIVTRAYAIITETWYWWPQIL
jgi:hypothetical protein